jgi:hypothetical protein
MAEKLDLQNVFTETAYGNDAVATN